MNFNEKIDYSALSTYLDCPRKFLFQYKMHLRTNNANLDLIFGACYHYGLEQAYLVLHNNSAAPVTPADLTNVSVKAFNALWAIEGTPHFPDQDIIFPKSPGHAANMYYDYWKLYLSIDKSSTVLAVESPFVIDIKSKYPDLPNYIGRLDLVLQDADGFLNIIDHKTAKAIMPTTSAEFEMFMQTDGYLTAGHMFYNSIPRITYSISLCQKSKIAFHRFIIMKKKSALDLFLNDYIYHVKRIMADLLVYENDIICCTNRDDIIQSFRRNPGHACTIYMRSCPYMMLCNMRANPLLWLDKTPQGFKSYEWDPDSHHEEMKNKLANN